jgi:hypothetical protein
MKPQIFILSTHAPATLKHMTKEAEDRGQTITKDRAFIGFSPSEALDVDMTPKIKAFRNMSVKEQVEARADVVPGSLESILSAVDMGDN